MTEPLFLTDKELGELTGIVRGSGGLTKHQLQVQFLRSQGLPMVVNARGVPKVTRQALYGTAVAKSQAKTWSPALAR